MVLPKDLQTIDNIYIDRYRHSKFDSSTDTHRAVLKRLTDYGGAKQRLSQLFDDEQQRELEHE